MSAFTPLASTIGGVIIGVSSVMMLALNGRIAGISGIVGGMMGGQAADRPWRLAFTIGLLGGGLASFAAMPGQFGGSGASTAGLIIAGVLVGVGTRLGSGCTSGHGVCGMSRLSGRSLAATATFMAVAAITVFFTRHVGS